MKLNSAGGSCSSALSETSNSFNCRQFCRLDGSSAKSLRVTESTYKLRRRPMLPGSLWRAFLSSLSCCSWESSQISSGSATSLLSEKSTVCSFMLSMLTVMNFRSFLAITS